MGSWNTLFLLYVIASAAISHGFIVNWCRPKATHLGHSTPHNDVKTSSPPLPNHVAFILDGNGRWAQKKGLPRTAGHLEGSQRSLEVLKMCSSIGIKVVTFYCMSTENWNRPEYEVAFILDCFEKCLRLNLDYAREQGIRVVVIGDLSRISPPLQALIHRAEEETRDYTNMTLCLALSYGGQSDIVQAGKALAAKVLAGELAIEDIDSDVFAQNLWTNRKGVPDPDLVIRTSGERRLSNFMLWQSAYTEIHSTSTLWPDFKEKDLGLALDDFMTRSRRFGRVLQGRDGESQTKGEQRPC